VVVFSPNPPEAEKETAVLSIGGVFSPTHLKNMQQKSKWVNIFPKVWGEEQKKMRVATTKFPLNFWLQKKPCLMVT